MSPPQCTLAHSSRCKTLRLALRAFDRHHHPRLNSRDTIRRALGEHNGRPMSIDPSPSFGDTTLIVEEQSRGNAKLFQEPPISPNTIPDPWIPLQDVRVQVKSRTLHLVSA